MYTSKYCIEAIQLAHPGKPHHLVRSSDSQLIMRRCENGNFMLFAYNQEIVVEIPAKDAKDFALWILLADQ
jgi:hypothetical protein